MKKSYLGLIVPAAMSCAFYSAAPQADTILGIYAGAGVWQATIDGEIGVDDNPITTDELGMEDENANYFYIALEHPVPVLPNIRLTHTTLENKGSATVSRNFTWDDQTFNADFATFTSLDLSQTDITLYYEVLDNWVSLDLGISGKIFDGEALVRQPERNASERIDISGGLPMLYAMARFDLPFSGLYVAAKGNYIGYEDSTVSDFDAHLGYRFESVLDVGAELGYREFKLTLDDFEDANADLTFSGPYLNLAVHF